MSKSFSAFIAEALDVPVARTVDGVVNQVLAECFSMIIRSRVQHLSTSSYAAHEALESFYTKLQDQTDDLAEKYLATGGRLEGFTISVLQTELEESCSEKLQQFRDQVSGAVSMTGDADLQSINDVLISIQKNIDQTSYLLDMT